MAIPDNGLELYRTSYCYCKDVVEAKSTIGYISNSWASCPALLSEI